jgi:O-antigen ligase
MPLLIAVLIGSIGALSPVALIPLAAILVIVLSLSRLRSGPETALMLCFFFIYFGETKFRYRDPNAALSAGADSQVIFELGFYALVFVIVAINWCRLKRSDLKAKPIELVILSYVLLAGLSTFWSFNPTITAVRAAQQFILYAFLFVAVRVLKPAGVLRSLAVTLAVAVPLFALMALLFPWANGTLASEYYHVRRFSWFKVHPIVAADQAGAALVLVACEALFALHSWRRRIVGLPLWIYMVTLTVILLATRSRGSLFAATMAVAVVYAMKLVRPGTILFVSLCVVLLVMTITVAYDVSIDAPLRRFFSESDTVGNFLLRGQTADEFLTVSGRAELWRAIYGLLLKRPLFGYGFVSSRRLLEILPWSGEAHNALIESLFGLGVVGTLLLWLPLGRTVVRSLIAIARSSEFEWRNAVISGVLLFVVFEGFVTAGFAGFLTYDAVLLFSCLFAFEHLRHETRGNEGSGRIAHSAL